MSFKSSMVAMLWRPRMRRETAVIGWGPLSFQGQGWHGYLTAGRAEAVVRFIWSTEICGTF